MKPNFLPFILIAIALGLFGALFTSCDDSKTYAELLTEENHYVNNFLADQRVINGIPEDTVFLTGPDAPYYRLDDDGNFYMQVLDAGTKGNDVEVDELIYFRYTRYALAEYSDGKLPAGSGNNITPRSASFRYGNYQLTSSSQWGQGIQLPLLYLPIDCKVNIVIKSQYGFSDETTYVLPYLYNLSYQRPQI